MKLKAELRELQARLEDADDAFYVGGDLDARRHRLIVERLSLKIGQAQDAIVAIEPRIDTGALLDRDYVVSRWRNTPLPGNGTYCGWRGARSCW